MNNPKGMLHPLSQHHRAKKEEKNEPQAITGTQQNKASPIPSGLVSSPQPSSAQPTAAAPHISRASGQPPASTPATGPLSSPQTLQERMTQQLQQLPQTLPARPPQQQQKQQQKPLKYTLPPPPVTETAASRYVEKIETELFGHHPEDVRQEVIKEIMHPEYARQHNTDPHPEWKIPHTKDGRVDTTEFEHLLDKMIERTNEMKQLNAGAAEQSRP